MQNLYKIFYIRSNYSNRAVIHVNHNENINFYVKFFIMKIKRLLYIDVHIQGHSPGYSIMIMIMIINWVKTAYTKLKYNYWILVFPNKWELVQL